MLILAKIIGVSTISPRSVLEIFQGSVMYTYLCTVLSDNVPLFKKMSLRAFMAQGQRHLSRDRTCPVALSLRFPSGMCLTCSMFDWHPFLFFFLFDFSFLIVLQLPLYMSFWNHFSIKHLICSCMSWNLTYLSQDSYMLNFMEGSWIFLVCLSVSFDLRFLNYQKKISSTIISNLQMTS